MTPRLLMEQRIIAGMIKFPLVAAAVHSLGPEILEDEYCREIGRSIITGESVGSDYAASPDCQRVAQEVLDVLASTDEAWAMRLLRRLVAQRERPVLAQTLDWAAAAIRDGQPVRHVGRELLAAFRRVRWEAA